MVTRRPIGEGGLDTRGHIGQGGLGTRVHSGWVGIRGCRGCSLSSRKGRGRCLAAAAAAAAATAAAMWFSPSMAATSLRRRRPSALVQPCWRGSLGSCWSWGTTKLLAQHNFKRHLRSFSQRTPRTSAGGWEISLIHKECLEVRACNMTKQQVLCRLKSHGRLGLQQSPVDDGRLRQASSGVESCRGVGRHPPPPHCHF